MIGGNVQAQIQIQSGKRRNAIGEVIPAYNTVQTIKGFLDWSNGDSKYSNYNAKIQESTHLFIADYVVLDRRIKAENSRLVIDGKVYDTMLIDNPMGLNKHFEIYLKYTGE